MKYVVDSTVLIAVARGNTSVIDQLSWYKRRDLGVPHPVLLDVHGVVKDLALPGTTKRWQLLSAELKRIDWTEATTVKLLALQRADLDAITAAHALALDAQVLTTDSGRYAWVDGLRVEAVFL